MEHTSLPLNISPADVLHQDALQEYEANMRGFHSQLGALNLNVLFCEHLAAFPAKLFGVGGPGDAFLFWTFFNAHRTAILFITRLITDQVRGAHTLPRFRKRLQSTLIRSEYGQAFHERMRKHHFDADRDEVLAKMRAYRNKDIAHLIPDAALIGPSLDEIKTMTTRVNALFQALSFNTEYKMETIGYDDGDRPCDLDRILDAVARTSAILTCPEDDPNRWAVRREHLSAEDLANLNHYRRKFGMSDVL
jgi:hypothetical protein